MTEDEEYWASWYRSIDKAGYKSLIPIEEYFSRDLTEACIMSKMWIDNGLLVKKDSDDQNSSDN